MKFIGLLKRFKYLFLYSLFRYFIRFMEVVLKLWYINHYPTVNWDEWVSWTPTSLIGCYFPFVIDVQEVTTGYYWYHYQSLWGSYSGFWRSLLIYWPINHRTFCSFLRHCNKRALLLREYTPFFIGNYLLALRFI